MNDRHRLENMAISRDENTCPCVTAYTSGTRYLPIILHFYRIQGEKNHIVGIHQHKHFTFNCQIEICEI